MLNNFEERINAVVFGASGSIGNAIIEHLLKIEKVEKIFAFSRKRIAIEDKKLQWNFVDFEDEKSIAASVEGLSRDLKINLIIVACGILHDAELQPEKSMRELDLKKMQKVFTINSFAPALIAKHFLPFFSKDKRAVFAAISARVGSISDNKLGGWYSYRASKAALNMMLKNLAIERARTSKENIIIGLHPGTVKSKLSDPFISANYDKEVFTPEFSAKCLLEIIDEVKFEDSGKIFAWDKKIIEP